MLNIKIERIRKRLTQAELAHEIGVNTFTIGRYETGESNPPIDVLRKLAKIFDVTVDYLIEEIKEAE